MRYEDVKKLYRNVQPFRSTVLNANIVSVVLTPVAPRGRRFIITEILIGQIATGTQVQISARLVSQTLNLLAQLMFNKNSNREYVTDVPIEVPEGEFVEMDFINGTAVTDVSIAGWIVDAN